MFTLLDTPIDSLALQAQNTDPGAGAWVAFEGWVRNHNAGQSVSALEYEAYPTMALKEGQRIIAEAQQRFDIINAHCVHRTGKLAIGEMAVWVGVAAAHRGDAFAACRYIIDEIKHRVPIWKKEYYQNGDSGWVNCDQCASHTHHQEVTANAYYARQRSLPEVGPTGQNKLANSKVLVVGAGGLGCPALLYLASAGIGTLGICEPDQVELSNLHRQILYQVADLGQPKAQVAAQRLKALNPLIIVQTHPDRLTLENAPALLSGYDLVLDCTDNLPTKFLLSDMAIQLKKMVVQASIYQYEGQLQVIGPNPPCLRCLWPNMPDPGCVGNCAEVGILGAVAGFFGTLQATEALKILLYSPECLPANVLLTVNLLNYEMRHIKRPINPDCPLCGIAGSTPTEAWYQPPEAPWEVDAIPPGALVVDIREPHEQLAAPLLDALSLPMSRFTPTDPRLDPQVTTVLVCAHGIRSAYLAQLLHQQGHTRFVSLAQGTAAYTALSV